jgi:hypothetical protein
MVLFYEGRMSGGTRHPSSKIQEWTGLGFMRAFSSQAPKLEHPESGIIFALLILLASMCPGWRTAIQPPYISIKAKSNFPKHSTGQSSQQSPRAASVRPPPERSEVIINTHISK